MRLPGDARSSIMPQWQCPGWHRRVVLPRSSQNRPGGRGIALPLVRKHPGGLSKRAADPAWQRRASGQRADLPDRRQRHRAEGRPALAAATLQHRRGWTATSASCARAAWSGLRRNARSLTCAAPARSRLTPAGATGADLSNKMANTIGVSNRLAKTYKPVVLGVRPPRR